MGLDGTGEISAFFSLVPFRLLGYLEQSITEIRDTPFEENKNSLRKNMVCLHIPFFSFGGPVGWGGKGDICGSC